MNEQNKAKQAQVLAEGSGYDCYIFARDIKGADIPALQSRVLEVGSGWDCYWFADNVEGADFEALQARMNELEGL